MTYLFIKWLVFFIFTATILTITWYKEARIVKSDDFALTKTLSRVKLLALALLSWLGCLFLWTIIF